LQPFFDVGYFAYRIENSYLPGRYLWPGRVSPPRRVRQPLRSWIGQMDLVLSREDVEVL
jgi:hypothetical protein